MEKEEVRCKTAWTTMTARLFSARLSMLSLLSLFAFAAAVTGVCEARAGGVEAVDWASVSGTYTVPADTTNEIATASDFDLFTNRISEVIFANDNSTLWFAVPTYPGNLPFQGPGTVLMSEKVILADKATIKRTLGSGDAARFVKFVFAKGIDSDDDATTRDLGVDPDSTGFVNAKISILGPVGNVKLGLNARIELGEDAYLDTQGNAIGYNGRTAMIMQRGGVLCRSSNYIGSSASSQVAYLMEGGCHTNSTYSYRNFYMYARYLNFRQTGGYFGMTGSWYRPESQNNESYKVIPSDFIFGGSAVATNSFGGYYGPMNLGVMGDAFVRVGNICANTDTNNLHIVAMNGGVLEADTPKANMNVVFAFNGGTRKSISYDQNYLFGNSDAVGNPAWVRVYENGGCVDHAGNSVNLPAFRAPEGNVLQSVEMSNELADKVWQTPPSVEITDATGGGSNAFAVVDYDFDSGKVTNITVVCRGENYSGAAGDVTANLRYKEGDALLSVPLACTVAPCESGGMTFTMDGNNHSINTGCETNTYRGMTVVDIDRSLKYTHKASSGPDFSININDRKYLPQFSSTGLVVRSGQFGRDYINSFRPSLTTYFPDCARVELYNAYFYGFAVTNVKDIVVGGETWLTNYSITDNNPNLPVIAVPADGTLYADYGATVTNGVVVTPALKYGYSFSFKDGAKVAIRNWETLPRGKRVVALDLSGMREFEGTPTIVESEEGTLVWDADEKKLYARRHSDGMFLIFR